MAATEEAVIFISRIERYFETTFPDDVRKEYLDAFKNYPPDVLSEAIARLLETTSHLRPPPTRSDIREQVQRIYETRAETRKANTPVLGKVIPFHKLPPKEREMAKESLALIQRVINRQVKTDDLPKEMRAMAEKYHDVNGAAWATEAASFEKWLGEFRALPTLKPGNLHPLPDVDRQLRPRVYASAQ